MTTHTRTLIAPDLAGIADWYKSSYSNGSGNNCVEVADLSGTSYDGIAIRDSKDPDGPALLVAPDGWTSFISSVKGGEFSVL
ncbi:DUF397 domain-containing protein [Streptomyces sp. 4503]|uniref:DUF397 domain-containing protein n=1 Tax=Streptomyces niphimycinicus TaxID=2842201 RepID=A0ABS6C9J5_9ACTN|nr:DUF397 domain-containing protein [Streptomyces niphimycinicus]MBU3863569.1 DUF397 domain-containing protein [Streptomyces niphimycinicus]